MQFKNKCCVSSSLSSLSTLSRELSLLAFFHSLSIVVREVFIFFSLGKLSKQSNFERKHEEKRNSSCTFFAASKKISSTHNANRLSRFEHWSNQRKRWRQDIRYRWAAGISHYRRPRLLYADYHLSCKYCLKKLLPLPSHLHVSCSCNLSPVKKVKENTRAQRASLKLGDAILSINGKNTEHMTLREANRCLANAASREVTLQISKWVVRWGEIDFHLTSSHLLSSLFTENEDLTVMMTTRMSTVRQLKK